MSKTRRSLIVVILGVALAALAACSPTSGGNTDPNAPTLIWTDFYQPGELVGRFSDTANYPCSVRISDRDLSSSEILSVRKPNTWFNPTMSIAQLFDNEQGISIDRDSDWIQTSVGRLSVYEACDGRGSNAFALWGAIRFNAGLKVNGLPVSNVPPADSDAGWSQWYFWPLTNSGAQAHLTSFMPDGYHLPPPWHGNMPPSWSGQAVVCGTAGTTAIGLGVTQHWIFLSAFNVSPKADDATYMTAWIAGVPFFVPTADLCNSLGSNALSSSVPPNFTGRGAVCNHTGTTTVATFVSRAKFIPYEDPGQTYHDLEPWPQDPSLVMLWDQGERLLAERADICPNYNLFP